MTQKPHVWVLSAVLFTVIGCSGSTKSPPSSAEAGLETGTRALSTVPVAGKTVPQRNLVAAGRALEAGEVKMAVELTKTAPETAETRLLLARIARANGELEKAVALYGRHSANHPELESRRITELAETLYTLDKVDDAVAELKALLHSQTALSQRKRLSLTIKMASWYLQAGRFDNAIALYKSALLESTSQAEQDRIGVGLGQALFAVDNDEEATRIVAPIALRASGSKWMGKALTLLKKNHQTPTWSAENRLSRARTLIAYRDWNNALATLKPLLVDGDGSVAAEASWLEAQILFQRRRHYKEAIAALSPIAKGGGTHAEEAQYLIARALARLDRDPESIKTHLAFAKTTKDKKKSAKATFHAARLEFYLGNHATALRLFEQLVGRGATWNGNKNLSASDKRDAHFMAGMSALLNHRPKRADPHFQAASHKTRNDNVLARNRYWTAVARVIGGRPSGFDLLRNICGEDPTSWYAQLATGRLQDANQALGPCDLATIQQNSTPSTASVKPLKELSSLAVLLANMGFYREAAAVLRETEKGKSVDATTRDWVANYIALDAPQYAIRRASIGLKWPTAAEERWRIQAAYPTPYATLVQATEDRHALPTYLIYAIARKESLFDPHVVSRVGAMGLMQMMPRTYEANRNKAKLPALAKGAIPGPEPSIQAAGYELESLLKRFDASLPLAIMAYNAGAAAVARWLERSGDLPLDVFVEKAGFAQTRNYVKRVYKNLVRYRQLEGLPPPTLPRTAARPKRK